MTDALHLFKTRRSLAPHKMIAPGPSAEQIDAILGVATRVPDHGKLTPWRFIVFEGEGRARADAIIAQVFKQKNPDADAERVKLESGKLSRAPVVIAVVSKAAPHVKIPEWEQVLSAGAVTMNLVWAANALGFTTAWLTEWYAFDRDVLDAFGLGSHEKIAGFVHIGTRGEPADDRPRPALADVVMRF